MNRFILLSSIFGFIMIVGFKDPASSIQQSVNKVSENKNKQVVPETLINFIHSKHPELYIPRLNEYVPGVKPFKSNIKLPFYCSSDFDGDGFIDHCLLLTNTKKELFLYSFMTFNGGFKEILIDTFDYQNNGIDVLILVAKKGQWEGIDEKLSVPNDGVTIERIEESLSWSYYFKDGEFERFLSD